MAGLGVAAAIMRDDAILLIQREDVGTWALPGGNIETGETAAEAAIREAKEETGFDVGLVRLIGLYAMPQTPDDRDDHTIVFAADIVGGKLRTSTDETLDARFFTQPNIPDNTLWHHRIRIKDALSGKTGVVRTQIITNDTPYLTMSREALYKKLRSGEITHTDIAETMKSLEGEIITHVAGVL